MFSFFRTLAKPNQKYLTQFIQFSFASKQKNARALMIKSSKKLEGPKLSPQVKEALKNDLEKHLATRDPTKMTLVDPESIRIQDVYKLMDTSLEGFFYKREYNLANFNFLLQVLAEQKKFDEALKAFEKMKTLNIYPNQITYVQLLTACSKAKDAQKAEEIFLEAKNNPRIGVSIQMYNSLMLCYTRRHEPEMALKILDEMIKEGIKPDIVCYTTVINAFKNTKNLKKCWELYDRVMTTEFIAPDENFIGLMIEICAGSHDAEKAKRLFADLEDMAFKETCLPYNAIIKALGSRKDYAREAIGFYQKMVAKNIVPDADTFIALFKATSNAGDVKTAFNGLMHLKQLNIPLNAYMFNGLLRTYAGACALPNIDDSVKKVYIQDAWNLFKQIQASKIPMNINLLNSLLYVHTKAFDIEKVEGLVLPLYDQYGIKKDEYTYQHLAEMYYEKRDLIAVNKLYLALKQDNLEPTYPFLTWYLETAMRLDDTDQIVEALKEFKRQKKEPRETILKKLCHAQDMPDRVYLELLEFDKKYGFLKDNVRRLRPKDKYSPM